MRLGILFWSATSGQVYLDISGFGLRVNISLPMQRPFSWARGFMFHEDWLWIYDGQTVERILP